LALAAFTAASALVAVVRTFASLSFLLAWSSDAIAPFVASAGVDAPTSLPSASAATRRMLASFSLSSAAVSARIARASFDRDNDSAAASRTL
jgi:hypothetical protein